MPTDSPLRASRLRRWRRLLLAGAGCVGLAFLFHVRFSLVLCLGTSMCPTFGSPELLLVDRAAFRDTGPRRGEVVVARHFGEWILKRVVGLPGETVAVREGRLWINGAPCPEPYPRVPGGLRIEPGTLQADRYALLGDNRSISVEENLHAVVAREHLLGRVVGSWGLGGCGPGQSPAVTGGNANPDPGSEGPGATD